MKRKGFFAALLCALLLGTLLPAAFAAEEAEEAAALAEDAGVSASEGFAVSVECSEGGTAHLTGGRERYDAGEWVPVSIVPDAGMEVAEAYFSYRLGVTILEPIENGGFTMPPYDTTVVVRFRRSPAPTAYTLSPRSFTLAPTGYTQLTITLSQLTLGEVVTDEGRYNRAQSIGFTYEAGTLKSAKGDTLPFRVGTAAAGEYGLPVRSEAWTSSCGEAGGTVTMSVYVAPEEALAVPAGSYTGSLNFTANAADENSAQMPVGSGTLDLALTVPESVHVSFYFGLDGDPVMTPPDEVVELRWGGTLTPPAPEREGYRLAGWRDLLSGKGEKVDLTQPFASDMELAAIWEKAGETPTVGGGDTAPADPPVYTVTLLPGAGSGAPIVYRSDEAEIAESFRSALNCGFYYEDNGALGFCMNKDYCPASFTAPPPEEKEEHLNMDGGLEPGYTVLYSFGGWDGLAGKYITLSAAETVFTVRWDERWAYENENEIRVGDNTMTLASLGLMPLRQPGSAQGGELRCGEYSIPFTVVDVTKVHEQKRSSYALIAVIRVDAEAAAAVPEGIYYGTLNYSWSRGSGRNREVVYGSRVLKLDLSYGAPGDYPPSGGSGDSDGDSEPAITPRGGSGSGSPSASAGAAAAQTAEAPAFNGFTDVGSGDWCYASVRDCAERGILAGYADGSFRPDAPVTRAQTVQILWNLAGKPVSSGAVQYSDVPADAWFLPALSWCAENGFVTGYADGNFRPNAPVTREQLAAMLYRYAKSRGQGFTGSWYFPLAYEDAASVSDFADEALHYFCMNGIIRGRTETRLDPQGRTTRAQLAVILQRYSGLA